MTLVSEYYSNASVHITDDNDNVIETPPTDLDGNYRVIVPLNSDTTKKNYWVSTEADGFVTKRKVVVDANNSTARMNLPLEDRPPSLLARAVIGYEQAGASAAQRQQNYFSDFYVSNPFPFRQRIDPDFGPRLRLWGDIRFASIPQEGDTAVGTFATNFVQQAAGVKVRDVARVFDFLAGVEVRLAGDNSLLPSYLVPGLARQTRQKFSLSFIASFGTITPTNPQEGISIFKVFPDAPGLPPEAKNSEFVAFVSSDRNRFFRQYYAGLRIQAFFFNPYNMPMKRFPAMFDVTYGQNEFVSGGNLHGGVFRLDGYFPLPYEDLKFINLFGTALLHPGRARTGLPLILQPAPAGTVVPASNVALVLSPQLNRDYYRAGVGIDFISFVEALLRLGSNR